VVGPFGHAPSLTFPLDAVEVEALPSRRVVLSRRSTVLWPPPTSQPASFRISLLQLIPSLTVVVAHRLAETSPVPSSPIPTSRSPYAGGFFTAASSGSSPLPWPSVSLSTSAPSFSLVRANISTLQDSLDVTGYDFASFSQGVTTLQHLRSPRSTGCLLRGGLTLTTTGLSPASRR
jgi:hypothetical protein